MEEKFFISAKVEIIKMDYQSIITQSGADPINAVIDPESGEIWNGGNQ